MAKNGFIIEVNLAASSVDALNDGATCTTDVDGGSVVELGAYNVSTKNYTVTLGGASAPTGSYIAYNPVDHITVVNGKNFSNLTVDPRDVTNVSGLPFSVFRPLAGVDKIGLTSGNFTGATLPDATTNKYVVPAANGQWSATSTAPTSGMYFTCIGVQTIPFPQAGIGVDTSTVVYTCKCTNN